MDARAIIGRFVRQLRERMGLTQDQVAAKTDIACQFLSGVENGRENFSIDVLASLARALNTLLPRLVSGAYGTQDVFTAPGCNADFFRPQVPLPSGMKVTHLAAALGETQKLVARINANLVGSGAKPLPEYIQGEQL
jgi:transcriptional regulator with XRE-family HTH domain